MTVFLDIIGSMMVRGMIVLIVLRMNVSLNTMIVDTTAHSTIQQRMAVLRQVMVSDFEAIGFNVVGTAFIDVKNHDIRFLGDVDGDGTPETISYDRSSTGDLPNTPNPNDRYIHRKVNSGTARIVADGITKIDFEYYDDKGAVTTDKNKVKSFKITAIMQDSHPVDGRYPSTFWEQTFYPPNI